MTIKYNLRLFIILFFALIASTFIMIFTHEFGHYIFGLLLGYNMTINYHSALVLNPNPNYIFGWCNRSWTDFGGPFVTMLTGTIGFILLFVFRKSFQNKDRLSFRQWILIIISLFWFRQIVVFIGDVINYFFIGAVYFDDEKKMSLDLNLHVLFLSILTGLIALTVFTIIIIKFVPRKQKVIFICSSLGGFIAGNILWLGFIGRYLLP